MSLFGNQPSLTLKSLSVFTGFVDCFIVLAFPVVAVIKDTDSCIFSIFTS